MTKKFELFFGTGGVGKTTVSCSRAIHLCQQGKKILLVTIDPAKRLKELLGLSDDNAGDVIEIKNLPDISLGSGQLFVLLMNPEKTIQRMAQSEQGTIDLAQNRIVKILSKPNGGMNEILSLVELENQFGKSQYDCIVLDTPPGSHFLDFLNSVEKMRKFFDSTFVDIFTSLGRKVGESSKLNVFNRMIETGIKKLLEQLEKVAGEKFVKDFLGALEVIYKSQKAFKQGLEIEKRLMDKTQTGWYLVTSTDQGKVKEALEMISGTTARLNQTIDLVINKTLGSYMKDWFPQSEDGISFKKSLVNREEDLINFSNQYFKNTYPFPEIIHSSPIFHVKLLAEQWNKYVTN